MATMLLKSKTVGLSRLLVREVVGSLDCLLVSVPSAHSCVSIRLYFLHGTIATTVYVLTTEARGLTVIVELRRYNRSKKLQNCVVISGFVVIDASLYPIFSHVFS